MNETVNESGGAGPSHRSVEIGVALVMALLAVIGIYGSLQVGINWAADGPRAGFFPFYVSLIVLISCVVNIAQTVIAGCDGKIFAERAQLRQVMSVLVPTAIYVALVPYIGIYVASALLIAFFMRWFGHYRWSIAAAVAVPVVAFFMFEVWFLVPLPKGPIENMLGY
jgi:putative tricarboxylic transport membrane protein